MLKLTVPPLRQRGIIQENHDVDGQEGAEGGVERGKCHINVVVVTRDLR